jgi:hypothetical protein
MTEPQESKANWCAWELNPCPESLVPAQNGSGRADNHLPRKAVAPLLETNGQSGSWGI